MNKIGLIIWREFITRVRKPSFLIMTILGPLLIGGGITAVVYLGMQESGTQNVLIIDQPHLLTEKLESTDKVKFFYQYDTLSIAVFKESPYTVMIDVNDDVLNDNTVVLFYKELPSLDAQRTISNAIEKNLELAKLAKDSIDVEAYKRVRKPLTVKKFDIENVGEESLEQERAGIGFFFGYLMFIFIFLYGVQVMRGVMEEKQNRIVEVLISSVRPFQLMMGKIVGIAAVGLTQFLLWAVLSSVLFTAGTALLLKDRMDPKQLAEMQMTQQVKEKMEAAGQDIPDVNDIKIDLPFTLAMFVFYFLCGYLLYSSLFAAVGSAVDSETDTQQFMFPVTLPMVLAIFIAQTAIYNPNSPAVLWCSIIPFTSPVVMMVRVAMGNALESWWQLPLSMALLAAAFIFTTWLAGRIYRTGILMYGKKVSWRELGKWLFYRG
jgi:ABC-2 type transport system permease protein